MYFPKNKTITICTNLLHIWPHSKIRFQKEARLHQAQNAFFCFSAIVGFLLDFFFPLRHVCLPQTKVRKNHPAKKFPMAPWTVRVSFRGPRGMRPIRITGIQHQLNRKKSIAITLSEVTVIEADRPTRILNSRTDGQGTNQCDASDECQPDREVVPCHPSLEPTSVHTCLMPGLMHGFTTILATLNPACATIQS